MADELDGLPEDLKRILRDQSVIVPQDQAVFEAIAKWTNAPSDTPQTLHPEWIKGWQSGYEQAASHREQLDEAVGLLRQYHQRGYASERFGSGVHKFFRDHPHLLTDGSSTEKGADRG